MQTQEVREPRVNTNTDGKIGGIGEDRGGIPVIAGLTFLMIAVVLFAVGYLLFTAPGPHHRDESSTRNLVNDRLTLSDGQRGLTPSQKTDSRTLDENPMSRTGTVSVPMSR